MGRLKIRIASKEEGIRTQEARLMVPIRSVSKLSLKTTYHKEDYKND